MAFKPRSMKKYFFYGLGEIILVVLGILIALQINNWNEQNKNQTLEQQILKELKVELTNNLDQLDQVIADREISLQVSIALLPSLIANRNIMDEQKINSILDNRPKSRIVFASSKGTKIDSLIGSIPSYWTYAPMMGNVKSIIYSGKINLITNSNIKICIAEFEDRVKSVNIATDGADEIMNEHIQPILKEYLKVKKSYPLDEVFNDFDFQFYLRTYIGWTSAAINTSENFSRILKSTIEIIDSELLEIEK